MLIKKNENSNCVGTYIGFIDFEKAHGRVNVNRKTLWHIMWQDEYTHHLLECIGSLHDDTKVVI